MKTAFVERRLGEREPERVERENRRMDGQIKTWLVVMDNPSRQEVEQVLWSSLAGMTRHTTHTKKET